MTASGTCRRQRGYPGDGIRGGESELQQVEHSHPVLASLPEHLAEFEVHAEDGAVDNLLATASPLVRGCPENVIIAVSHVLLPQVVCHEDAQGSLASVELIEALELVPLHLLDELPILRLDARL
eukprot:1384147-Pyramimonas_sp.AAC.1